MVKGDDKMISFKLNKKIQIYTENEMKMGDSTVQDEDENNVFISVPMGPGGNVKLVPGDIIRATYCGPGNKFYEFMTEVDSIVSDDRIPLIKINKPKEYQVIQRREFVRIPIMLDIKIFVADEDTDISKIKPDKLKSMYESEKWIGGYAFDLSAGGLGSVLLEPIDYGRHIFCMILDPYFDTGFRGKIVRSTTTKKAGKKLYKIGVQFIGLDYRTEEKLVKYIFQKMREQLKVR